MPQDSFQKFIAQFDGFRKDESDISPYEKFGDKTKARRRGAIRENRALSRRAPAKLDLHGRTVAESEIAVLDFIRRHPGEIVEIITGRGGKMRNLFPEWAAGFLAPFIAEYRLMNTGGAWEVRIGRRSKSAERR